MSDDFDIGPPTLALARLLRDQVHETDRLRTVLGTVEHRLVEMQRDADAYGAKALGTKLYALRQFVHKYGALPPARMEEE